MTNTKPTSKDEATTSYLPSLAKATAAAAALGGITLHLMGHTAHSTYLRQMGVAPEAFPKATDWLVINGYYTLADRFLALLNILREHWLASLAVVTVTTLYVFFYKLISKLPSKKSQSTWVKRLPTWIADLIDSVVTVSLFYSLGGMAIFIIMFVLLVPAVLGETAGKNLAERDLIEFRKGCLPESACFEVVRDGEMHVKGYLVATSPSHAAVYDPSLEKVRIVALDGVELQTIPRQVTQER